MRLMKSTAQRTNEEELLKILGGKSPVGACIIQDGKFCYVNSNFPLAIGYTADELMGKDPLELIVPEDREMVRENEIKMLKGKLVSPYQFRVIHKNGSIRWVMEVIRSIQYHGRRAVLGNYMEVTERKQMEEALKQREERYEELADSITDIFFAMDEHLKCTYWNRASEILTGIREEDVIGKSLREIFRDTPGTRNAEKMYHKVLKTQQPRTFVNDYDINGRHYIFEISAYPSRGGISVFIKDITEHKQSEEKLKESEQKYRLLFETSLDCIAQIDREGKFLAANPATARSLGVPLEELIGKTFFEVMPKEIAQHRLENVREVLDAWQPQIFEDERAGRYFHHMDIPIKISEQKEAVQVITRDITERKQAEEKLRQSEGKYRALFDSSVIGTIVLDAETMKIVMCNQAAAKMFGFGSVEEALGIDALAVVPPEDQERVLALAMKSLFEYDSQQAYELRAVTKDGQKIWINATGARIMHEGKLAGLISFTDITEHKKMEETLELQKAYFQQLFDNSPDAIVMLDTDTRVVQANKGFEELFGYPLGETRGRTIRELIIPEDRLEESSLVSRTVFQGNVVRKELVRRRKDGKLLDVSMVAYPIRFDDKLVGIYSIYSDITERKQTEEALRQSEEKYRTILKEMEDSYFEVDLGGHLTFVNDSVCRNLGYSREELIGMSYKDFTTEEDIESVFRIFNEVYRTGVPNKGFPWKIVRKDMSQGFVEASISLLRDDKGGIVGFRGVGRDITERKQTEEKLRRSRERYRALFDSSVIGTLVVDAETMKVIIGNQAAVRMFGFSSMEEGMGVNLLDFVPPEEKQKALELIKEELFERNSRRAFDFPAVMKDGRRIWISATGAKITHRGKLAGLLSFVDITERKQAEEKLRQSEENYKTLFNSSAVGMYVLDVETLKVVMGNRAAAEMAGFSSVGEGLGINPFDFVFPEDREQLLEIAAKEYEQDLRRSHEVRVIGKDGGIGWITISSARITHEGRPASLVSISNITERKRMEEALRQGEENYRALFDSSVTGTFVVDAETMKVVIGNQSAAKMFGFGFPEEAIGLNPLDFVFPEDKERAHELIVKDLFEQDLRTTHELRAITKDGRTIWISVTAARIMHAGRLAGLISFTDITERKQAEEKLRQSKENYRALFDSSVIGAVVVDAETMKVVMANEATLKMFGFSSPEEGVNPLDFSPPEDRQRNLELIAKEVFGKNSRVSIDLPVVTKDGRKIWVSVTGARIMHASKLAALFSFTDITERKQAEEALQQSEENYRVLFDSAVIGTVVRDVETMKIVMVNQAAVKMFGFSSVEEAIQVDPFSFIFPEDRERYIELATKAMSEQKSHGPYEIRVMTKDGREKWISVAAAMIMHKNRPASLISFADITEQKQQTERLMMTDRLASLGELASGTAHELNNPLTSIIGFSQLLLERQVPDDIREDLKLINNEAQRAASVTKNLLTFARRHTPVKQRNQINNIIEDVLKLRAYEHKANNIEVERKFAPDLPEIMVDYFQMQQVFMNVIINAEYFMAKAHNSGILTITTQKQNDTVVISFADDGLGIPPENLRRIFDPFFTTKEAGKGTGLGLSICHGIVTEHGGQIYARSQLGKGATIFVELPISGS